MTTKQKLIEQVQQYVERAKTDPIVYIDRFFYTFDPRRDNPHLRFRLFDFQKKLINDIKAAIDGGTDIFIDKSRDMGVTYTILSLFLWYWMYVAGSNFLVGSRKEDYVDNRFGKVRGLEMSNKEESLFGKMEYMLRKLPAFLLPQGFDIQRHLGYMKLVNPQNGNVIMGESSNRNFSRGGRFKAVLLDEFAFWEEDQSVWGATADTTQCRIVATTAGERPCKAKRLRFGKDGENIRIIEVAYTLDPRKDVEWAAKERSRRSREDFAREIERNWETAIHGIVYTEIAKARVGEYPYVPKWPLYIAWDFGLDGTALQWWQVNLNNNLKRLVQAYENRDKPVQYYFPFFGQPIDSLFGYTAEELELIRIVGQWKKAIHFGDPDVAKRAYQDQATISTRSLLEQAGIYIQTRPEANDFQTRRDRTKVLLQAGIEVNDTAGTRHFMECIQSARYPERTDTSQAVTPITLPIHDQTSHMRTALEYFAVNYDVQAKLQEYTFRAKQAWDTGLQSRYDSLLPARR
jgi:hypothetical protein